MCITCFQQILPVNSTSVKHATLKKTITRPVFHDSAWLDWDTELFEVVRDISNHIDLEKVKAARVKGKVPHMDLYVKEITVSPVDIEIFSETGWRIEIQYDLVTSFDATEGTHLHPLEKLDYLPLPEGVDMSDLPLLRLGEVMQKTLVNVFKMT